MAGADPERAAQPDLVLRPGSAEDLPVVHDVFVAASAQPGHPVENRSPAEVRAWIDTLVGGPLQLWVAEAEDRVVGFATLLDSWVSLLFVHPDRHRQGVGAALLDLVKGLRPDGFGLRVHQANNDARAFYRAQGLVELERTDGAAHRDAAPDVQLAWLGADPIGYLRRCIDEVDDELAVLLARRLALTAAVQDHKEGAGRDAGPRGRDADREAEIVRRMAGHVPELGAERIARVMHAVIAESLAAWESRDPDTGAG